MTAIPASTGHGQTGFPVRGMAVVLRVLALLTGGFGGYLLLVRGALTVDLGVGRRIRPLGPLTARIAAPPETVFDVVAAPYLSRTPRAMRDKLEVLERGSDMVLAAHFTRVGRLTATTVETVRFERPHRISFRVVRGPVPHVVERFKLEPADGGTTLVYTGELGTDLWRLGQWWGDRVAAPWERTVAASLESTRAEAERRSR
jgi:Polyketide cyclase / dehydrase and lipid transport